MYCEGNFRSLVDRLTDRQARIYQRRNSMSSGRYRILIYFVLLFALTVNIVLAGTTGKIAGRVVDKETAEPLVGINVVVKGTSLGASTDIDGYYAILSVQPGIHTITVSGVGYSSVTVNGINVLIDQTATVNVEMMSQAIQSEAVVVTAERHVVKKDVSSSVSALQPEEMVNLPVASVNDMVSLQAGVEDGFIIRGGAASDMLLNVDGATQRDPRNNKPISNIALSSIQEVSIEKGGFAAEYGQARTGIVNIVQKEGNVSHYSGSLNVKYSPPQQKYFGISEYDPNSMWNRPYMDPAVCWTGTNNGAWSIYQQNQYPKFVGWNAVSQLYLSQGINLSPAACQRIYEYQHRLTPPTNSPDYNIDGSIGGPVPIIGEDLGNLRFFTSFIMNKEMLLIPLSRPDYEDYNWSVKLNSDITKNTKLLLNASVGKSYNVAINATDNGYYNQSWQIQAPGTYPFWNPTDFLRTPDQIAGITYEGRPSRVYDDSWYCTADVTDFNIGAKLTTMLSASTYYEISIQNEHRSYLTGPIAARDTAQNYEIAPGYFVDESPYGYSSSLLTGIADQNFIFGGHSSTARDSSTLNTLKIKGDLTSQVTKEHMLKAGFEFSYYDLNMNYGTNNVALHDVDWVKEHYNPYLFSAYVQDKIEAYGFIANIGIRMDVSNPNTTWVNADPFDQSFFSAMYNDTIQYAKERVKTDVAFSPRLGISHPITETSKLYFNYGHFKEMPAYDEIYRIGRGQNKDMRNYGNPNLPQAQTVSYELGFDQSLFDSYLIQIAAFYNDISSQQAFTYYMSSQKSIGYYAANNNSYSDIRGVEFTLRKTSGDWVRGFINYTYQVVALGQFGQVAIADNPADQAILDRSNGGSGSTASLYLLARQKPVPQPRANASITVFTPKDFGPHFLSVDPLGDWSLNVVGTWKAGQWLTYNPNNAAAIQNNVQVTDYTNINLRLNKTFSFKNFAVTVFMETNNLLNEKRLSGESFYDGQDFNDYMGSLHLPQSSAYNNINIPGSDRVGDYCKDGIYTPILVSGNVNGINTQSTSFDPTVIYYDSPTGKYKSFVNGSWVEVDHGKMQKILDNKEYIDMPNNSSFNFLNPRQFYYGINLSFTL
jgi:outer membrane receptor protein involved in Fe transport